MRFALLGDHIDGLDMARALADSGRHQLAVYSGPKPGLDYLARFSLQPRTVGDLEEILADPTMDAVIVASGPALRQAQLRRTLQSERHALCVHPVGDSPDQAYEAGMIQTDVGRLLLPLLQEFAHPGIRRLAELAHASAPSTAITATLIEEGRGERTHRSPTVHSLPGAVKLVEIERWSTEEVLLQPERDGQHASLAGWDILRLLGGEIGEIFVLAGAEEFRPDAVLLVSGQFLGGGLFQETLLPCQAESRLRLALVTLTGRAELLFPQGLPGPAELTYRDAEGAMHSETWPTLDPWPSLVECFEAELDRRGGKTSSLVGIPARLSWQDEIRALELDDAARRSAHRHRASTLDYQEATEEASFKGTMTLVGCGLLWLSVILLIMSAWYPWMAWFILPAFGVFLGMQFLRLIVKKDVQ